MTRPAPPNEPPTEAPPTLSRRARRGITLIAISLAAVTVSSLIYLHPQIGGPAPQRTTAVPTTPLPPLIHDRYWAGFAFVSPTTGWALVAGRWIYKTTDGARTWKQQLSVETFDRPDSYGDLNGGGPFQFFSPTRGLAFLGGHGVYGTSDAGQNWAKVNLPPYNIESLTFSDLNHAWLIGWTQSGQNKVVYGYARTSDGGTTWTPLPPPPPATRGPGFAISGFKFRSPAEGWAGGTDPEQPSVYRTKDGGFTWSQVLLPVPRQPAEGKGSATSATLLPGGGVLATFRDAAFTSFDGGDTWQRLPPTPFTSGYRNLVFQDARHWWSMQYDGSLYKSSDAGQTWNRVSFQSDEMVYDIGVVDARHAWATLHSEDPKRRGYGLALTSDGGTRWTYAAVPNPP